MESGLAKQTTYKVANTIKRTFYPRGDTACCIAYSRANAAKCRANGAYSGFHCIINSFCNYLCPFIYGTANSATTHIADSPSYKTTNS